MDGKPLDVDAGQQAFARAMSAPPVDDLAAPPRRSTIVNEQVTADSGTSKKIDAEGPDSKTVESKSKTTRAKPRTVTPVKRDYTSDAQQVVTAAWTVAAALPPTQAVAYVLNTNADPLVAALAEGARHNETIRNALTGTSEHGWKLSLAVCALNMGLQTLQVMRDPKLREQAAEHTREQIAQVVKAATPEGDHDVADAA